MFKNIVMAWVGDTVVAVETVDIAATDQTVIDMKRRYPTARISIEIANMKRAG